MVKYFNKHRIRLRNGSLISFPDGHRSTFNRAEAEQIAELYRSFGAECIVETFSSNIKVEDVAYDPALSREIERAKVFSGRGLAHNAGHESKRKQKDYPFNPQYMGDNEVSAAIRSKYKRPDVAFAESALRSKGLTTLPKEKHTRTSGDNWDTEKYSMGKDLILPDHSGQYKLALDMYDKAGFVEACRTVRSTYGLPNRMAKRIVSYAVDNLKSI
jgi:hypothetical protein